MRRIILTLLLGLMAVPAYSADLWRPKGQPAFMNQAGKPYAGAKLCYFDAGTTSPRTVYKDANELVPWSQPITLNSAGGLDDPVYVASGAFKEVFLSSDAEDCVTGQTLYTADNIPGAFDISGLETTYARPQQPTQAKATNYTITTSDLGGIINCDATGGNVTLTLPSAATAANGGQITARKVDASANTCSFATVSDQTINGASSYTLSFQRDGATLVSDGSNWIVSGKAFSEIHSGEIADGTIAFVDIAASAYSTSTTLSENSDTLFPTQRAVKSYVDTAVTSGVKWKEPVVAATTANINLSSDLENNDTIDGVTLATGQRVLVKNQSTASQNGIYIVAASGAASRATDSDEAAELNGATVFVSGGSTNANRQYTQTATVATVGSDAVTWTLIAAGSTYQADETTLTLSGSTFSIKASGVTATQIGTGAVTSAKILDGTIATADIADGAVNAAKIANATIGMSDLSSTVTAKFTQSFIVAASDETTALTTGANKVKWRMPYAFTVSGVRCSLSTAQSSGSIFTVDINEGGTSILSTKVTIDNNETTSTTAATAPVISDSSLADDAEMSIDIDQVGNGTAKGLKCAIIGSRT
jgi:hypothetical protein